MREATGSLFGDVDQRSAPHIVTPRPRLLDLYCGEGGAGMGYHYAGFEVVGVDLNDDHAERRHRPRPKPLKRYPFESIEGDAIDALESLLARGLNAPAGGFAGSGVWQLGDFAAIHASPPCQAFSPITKVNGRRKDGQEHPDLIGPTRDLLRETGLPYVIENVPEAPIAGILLCGSMFDPPLDVRRHRVFEANWPLEQTMWGCRHKLWSLRFPQRDYRRGIDGQAKDYLMRTVPVYGGTRFAGDRALRRLAMEMDWTTLEGLNEAIPPRYTEFIGRQLLAHVALEAVA